MIIHVSIHIQIIIRIVLEFDVSYILYGLCVFVAVCQEVPQVVDEERVVEVPQMQHVEAITEDPKPQMQRVEKTLD